MADGVKRSYDASTRQARALEARRAVIAAARTLVEEQGYAATTIAGVARAAGVSAESVYKGFGSKAALLKAVFDVVIAGDDEPVAVAERPEADRIREEPDVREKLRLYAAGAAVRAERSARIQLVIRDGAAGDPALAELWETLQQERLTGMTFFARHLAGTGQLREGVGVEEARDVLWTGIAVEVHDLLVRQRGWTSEAYGEWLGRMLVASLT